MSLSTLFIGLALIAAGVCGGMAFTAWGKRRPLHRYGALSVAAHLLLLAWMAGVRIGGPPQAGAEDAPPVKVRIVMRSTAPQAPEAPQPEEPVETSPLEEAPKLVEVAPPEVTPQKPEAPPAAPNEAEPITSLELDSDFWALNTEPTDPLPKPDETPTQSATGRAEPQVGARPETPSEPLTQTDPTPVPRPPSLVPSPLAPSAYAQRGELAQRRLSADEGGSAETLDAVAAAVDWLARAQRADGAWDAAQWGAGRETYTLDQDRKGAGKGAETALTGLALLAMGGAGHTHLAGPYRDSVTRGLQFLLDAQEPSGAITGDATLYAKTYCHSMATFALAEAMAVSQDERLRPAVEAAVGYLVRAQSRSDGGWRYQPGDRGDMSQMGWAVMALRSAELAGVAIPPATWNGCERFVQSVRGGSHGGLAAYQEKGQLTSTMTAEAMYCRQILGLTRPGNPADSEAAAFLMSDLPGMPGSRSCPGGKPNLYYWYYATLALHHHSRDSAEARDAWDDWNAALQRSLLSKQIADGPTAGSWGADTIWGGYGGRVYSTAVATMCLEVYYRYDPETIGRDPWLASRVGGVEAVVGMRKSECGMRNSD